MGRMFVGTELSSAQLVKFTGHYLAKEQKNETREISASGQQACDVQDSNFQFTDSEKKPQRERGDVCVWTDNDKYSQICRRTSLQWEF